MPVVLDEACEAVEVRLPQGSAPGLGLKPGECAPILGRAVLRELLDGLLWRFSGGPPSSCGGGRVYPGLSGLGEGAVTVGTLVLLLARRPGMTLFLIPRPVIVSPLSGSLMGK